jgi:hypothetical protein
MQTATAKVIDFDAYRRRRHAEPAVFPVAWVMVWFAPVVFIRPYASFG